MSQVSHEIIMSEEEIKAHVTRLALEIARDHAGKRVMLVFVLRAAVLLAADLMAALQETILTDYTIAFAFVDSYGNGMVSSGEPKVILDPKVRPSEYDVVIVCDVVKDSGRTQFVVDQRLREMGAVSVLHLIVALKDRPRKPQYELSVDYLGQWIPDRFVAGYGTDKAERFRGIRYLFDATTA